MAEGLAGFLLPAVQVPSRIGEPCLLPVALSQPAPFHLPAALG